MDLYVRKLNITLLFYQHIAIILYRIHHFIIDILTESRIKISEEKLYFNVYLISFLLNLETQKTITVCYLL